jgi:hypothetical protein
LEKIKLFFGRSNHDFIWHNTTAGKKKHTLGHVPSTIMASVKKVEPSFFFWGSFDSAKYKGNRAHTTQQFSGLPKKNIDFTNALS